MSVRAIIVGIEKYDESERWDVSSPCANAVAIAEWLLDREIAAPTDVHLFLSPAEGDPAAALRARKVDVRDAKWSTIDAFIGDELAAGCPTGSQLLLYWSGHAVSDNRGHRILFCQEYKSTVANRVFNANLLFRRLNTKPYRCFDEMIALLDVCGTRHQVAQAAIRPDNSDPGDQLESAQLIYFAVPEAEEALASTGEGAFTYCALQTLRQYRIWPPDQAEFSARLDAELARSELPGFSVTTGADGDRTHYYGKTGREKVKAADSVIALLRGLDVSLPVLHRHYAATASSLGSLTLKAQSLPEMVRDLTSLRDEAGPISYGLIQFLLRVSEEPGAEEAIGRWLAGIEDRSGIKTQGEELAKEKGRKFLIVQLDVDEQGRWPRWQPSLRNVDFSLVQGRTFELRTISGWDDFETGLIALLTELEEEGLADELEIHIVVEPLFYDRPFHLLPSPKPGISLGEAYVVVIHHPDRVCKRESRYKDFWRKQTAALAKRPLAELEWEELRPTGAVKDDAALWYAGFPLPYGLTAMDAKTRLGKLLLSGAPVVYWRHNACEAPVGTGLKSMMAPLPNLGELARAFHQARLRDNEVAVAGSLLLDDASFDPFTSSKGVQLK